MRRTCAYHAENVSAITARWLFTCEDTPVNAHILVGCAAVSSRSMARWMFTNASTLMLGPTCAQSAVVALSSARCYATTCARIHRNVLMVVRRVAKPFVTTICGTCISVCIQANSRLHVSAVLHASRRARLSAVTWEHMPPSATATAKFVAKASHSAVIFALTWEFIRERDHLFVNCVDNSLHTTVHWKSTISDTVVTLY